MTFHPLWLPKSAESRPGMLIRVSLVLVTIVTDWTELCPTLLYPPSAHSPPLSHSKQVLPQQHLSSHSCRSSHSLFGRWCFAEEHNCSHCHHYISNCFLCSAILIKFDIFDVMPKIRIWLPSLLFVGYPNRTCQWCATKISPWLLPDANDAYLNIEQSTKIETDNKNIN